MNVILLGPPGSGKGTQGAILAARIGTPKIATGDLLRTAVRDDTPLGRQAKSYMDQGLLVPDEIILGLIGEVLEQPDARRGVIMDGFPRTVAQAEAVEKFLSARALGLDHVLTFEVPEQELVRRMMNRAADEGRSDDTPNTIKKRLGVYREQTEPLISFYEKRGIVSPIPGIGTVEEIAMRVEKAVAA